MRIIAGEYRSRVLATPAGLATRPTTDRLRETLFNVLAPRIEGARFADLYAGSGANGLEALSRGAAFVWFVERAAPALGALHRNLATLAIDKRRYAVEPRSVSSALKSAAAGPGQGQGEDRRQGPAPAIGLRSSSSGLVTRTFDLVFLDPPYEAEDDYAATLAALGGPAAGLLRPDALVIAEHARRRPPAARFAALERGRLLEQGDAALSFYSLTGSPPVLSNESDAELMQ